MRKLTRLTGVVAVVSVVPLVAACGGEQVYEPPGAAAGGRLAARPGTPGTLLGPGMHPLGLDAVRDGFIYVPERLVPGDAAPLMVALHGAGGEAAAWTAWTDLAEEEGLVLLAVDSRSSTWDVALAAFGPDVEFIDRALMHVFARVAVDPSHLALAGFSDGASYALSLGLTNGDLFSHILAFSPGFIRRGEPHGEPRIFISHGTADRILPIDATSRQLVPALREAGYSVTYEEFEGGHNVPEAIARRALAWFRS